MIWQIHLVFKIYRQVLLVLLEVNVLNPSPLTEMNLASDTIPV